MNWNTYTFRCSSLGALMTDPRSKSEAISETAKAELIETFVSVRYNREKVVTSKFLEKGTDAEEDAITLLSLVTRRPYFKNEERLFNDFINGEPDLYDGQDIYHAEAIYDTKCSWDIYSFFKSQTSPLNKDYYWQMQGYMALTGAKIALVVYCLVDTPTKLIEDEKRKLFYSGPWTTMENEEYLAKCEAIERQLTYPDIDKYERMFMKPVERNEDDILKIYERIQVCRNWLNENYPIKTKLTRWPFS